LWLLPLALFPLFGGPIKLVRLRDPILAAICAAVLLQPALSSSKVRRSKDLGLDWRLEKTRYAEAEPILAFISLTNRGETDRRVPPTRSLVDGLGLFLLSLDGSRTRVMPRWMDSSAFGGSPATLAAGETVAGVSDLLPKYGEYRRGPGSIADRLGATALPPGRYRVVPSLTVDGPNSHKRGSYELVDGDSIEFTVVPLGKDSTSAQLVEAFLQSASWKEGEYAARTKYCEDWIPRFYSSGFLPTVFLASGSHMRVEPLDVLLSALRAHGASDIMRAYILQTRLTIEPGGPERKRALLEKVTQSERTGATAAIIKASAAIVKVR